MDTREDNLCSTHLKMINNLSSIVVLLIFSDVYS